MLVAGALASPACPFLRLSAYPETVGGQTRGAYYENQNSSGSSSGSDVAASIGLALATLGTETRGSIMCPANANNVVSPSQDFE